MTSGIGINGQIEREREGETTDDNICIFHGMNSVIHYGWRRAISSFVSYRIRVLLSLAFMLLSSGNVSVTVHFFMTFLTIFMIFIQCYGYVQWFFHQGVFISRWEFGKWEIWKQWVLEKMEDLKKKKKINDKFEASDL